MDINYCTGGYIKIIILELGGYESTILDERNFSLQDEQGAEAFLRTYRFRDDLVKLKIMV